MFRCVPVMCPVIHHAFVSNQLTVGDSQLNLIACYGNKD